MATKTPDSRQPKPLPMMLWPRNLARERLLSRYEIGTSIRATPIMSKANLDELQRSIEKWNDFNREMLRRMFTTEEYALKYNSAGFYGIGSPGDNNVQRDYETTLERLDAKLLYLTSLAERLDLIEEAPSAHSQRSATSLPSAAPRAVASISRDIFLVHGRDEEAKSIVARFLEHCKLRPIILHELADRGLTIIEKFEGNANVGFAVVILTPDDLGGLQPGPGEKPQLQSRARQNVILELGYFIGKLGRERVCALRKGNVELPSDYSGVIFTPFGPDEGWKIRLAKEIREAGIDVDMNEAFG